jgi:hypothetical protein
MNRCTMPNSFECLGKIDFMLYKNIRIWINGPVGYFFRFYVFCYVCTFAAPQGPDHGTAPSQVATLLGIAVGWWEAGFKSRTACIYSQVR